MIEQYKINDALRHLKLVHYLLSRADERGMTHGEKHHLLQVAGMEMREAEHILGDDSSPLARNLDTDITPVASDIPF